MEGEGEKRKEGDKYDDTRGGGNGLPLKTWPVFSLLRSKPRLGGECCHLVAIMMNL